MIKPGSKLKATLVLVAIIMVANGANYIHYQEKTTKTRAVTLFSIATLRTLPISATTQVNDSNWAGYIIASNLQNPQPVITSVSASWVVPHVTLSSPADSYSAVWIGIGGLFDTTLIQTGTEQDSIGDQAVYSAWYELLPQVAITIGDVSPGDLMNASIRLVNANTNTWLIYIEDVTQNEIFQSSFSYAASMLSAEWVVERPVAGRTLADLADVGKVAINNCLTTVGTQSGSISVFPYIESIMFDIVQNNVGTTQLTLVSDLSPDGSTFTVETSPFIVPEHLSAWIALTLITAIPLIATTLKKSYIKKRITDKSEPS